MLLIKLLFLVTFISYEVTGRHIGLFDPVEPVVAVKAGKIKGRKHNTIVKKRAFYGFRGIPFAEPPVDDLRFEPPVPKKNWSGVIDAIEDASPCVQGGNPVVGSEDCLYLNVYTTQVPLSTDTLLPVMVFIYGGGFQAGLSTYAQYGPDYFLDEDIIIVTLNYRLGIFGFISTGDLIAPGNNGLKDQVLALKWVKENIRTFGGNPDKITIFGQSAGSASVSYLLQSRLTKGLFNRAIMESGVSLSLWAYSRHNVDISFTVGKDLNVNTVNSRELLKGLRQFNYTYLHATATAAVSYKYLTVSAREGFMFSPVIEPEHSGAFLTEKSYVKLARGDFERVPCIVGFNSLEGTFEIGALMRLILAKWDLEPWRMVPIDMNINTQSTKTDVGLKIKSKYFGLMPVALSNIDVMKFFGDDQFVRPIRQFVRLTSNYTRVYFYRFSYEGNLWGITDRTNPGVGHSEELGYLWRSNFTATPQDEKTRARMITMWTMFAKYGNPTPKPNPILENVIWPSTSSSDGDSFSYMDIGNHLEIRVNPEEDKMQFWDELYKSYGHEPYDTY